MTKGHILIRLSESDHVQFGKKKFELQSFPQKVFSAVWSVESEVNNGGFWQYFVNDSAETTSFVVEALRTVGAAQTADICQRALAAAFPEGVPGSTEEIRVGANSLSASALERLDELNQEFFSYPNNLNDLLFAYVLKYPEEFGKLPQIDEA